jgi:hypothetical protein
VIAHGPSTSTITGATPEVSGNGGRGNDGIVTGDKGTHVSITGGNSVLALDQGGLAEAPNSGGYGNVGAVSAGTVKITGETAPTPVLLHPSHPTTPVRQAATPTPARVPSRLRTSP